MFSLGALLFRLFPKPFKEISLKYGNERRSFLEDTQTHGVARPPLLCTAYYLFSVHQNLAGE